MVLLEGDLIMGAQYSEVNQLMHEFIPESYFSVKKQVFVGRGKSLEV